MLVLWSAVGLLVMLRLALSAWGEARRMNERAFNQT
jgi:hypothetical protein